MSRAASSFAPEGEEFPLTVVAVPRDLWDRAVRDVRGQMRRRVIGVPLLVLAGGAAGFALPGDQRWAAAMVGVLAGGFLAIWLEGFGTGLRRPAKREVADLLRSAGVPRVTVHDLRRIQRHRRVVVHHREIESDIGDGEVVVTVLDLSGRYWGPRGWAFVFRHAD